MLAGVGYGDHPVWDREYALKEPGEGEGEVEETEER